MPEESFQEKTAPATPRRRQDARKKGQVARSMELNSFAILFVGVLTLFFAMSFMMGQITELMRMMFQSSAALDLSAAHLPRLFYMVVTRLLIIIAPLLIAVAVPICPGR